MKIIVMSCDKNEDTFEPFHYFLEKYYPNHPEAIYFTESVNNPFYKTISVKHELSDWTRGVREFLSQVDDDRVLLMIDDLFIREPVDTKRIDLAEEILDWSQAACLNFEKSWDKNDKFTEYVGWKRREHGSEYEVSLMCGLWNKEKLIHVLDRNCTPWEIELKQEPKGYDYLINSGNFIINWGYEYSKPCNIIKGKWTGECVDYLRNNGFDLDFDKRGYYVGN